MARTPKKAKQEMRKSRKKLVKCIHCGAIVTGTRRQHLKEVDGITQDDGSLIPKSAVRKHFVQEDAEIEEQKAD